MRWIVLHNPDNNKKGSSAWRVEPLEEHIEMNLQALLNDEDFPDWHVVSGVYKSFFEAGEYLDELKERISLNIK